MYIWSLYKMESICPRPKKDKKKENCDLSVVVLCVLVCHHWGVFEGLCQAEFSSQMSLQDAVRSQCDRCPHVKTPTVALIELVP